MWHIKINECEILGMTLYLLIISPITQFQNTLRLSHIFPQNSVHFFKPHSMPSIHTVCRIMIKNQTHLLSQSLKNIYIHPSANTHTHTHTHSIGHLLFLAVSIQSPSGTSNFALKTQYSFYCAESWLDFHSVYLFLPWPKNENN